MACFKLNSSASGAAEGAGTDLEYHCDCQMCEWWSGCQVVLAFNRRTICHAGKASDQSTLQL